MKIAFFDCQSGISGDMILGSLINLGLDIKKIRLALKSLDLPEYKIKASKTVRSTIVGTKFDVVVKDKRKPHQHSRNFPQIKRIIDSSDLPEKVKTDSVEVFKLLGNAEAKVHGTTLNKIHFHEVGAVDSIIDIVGGALAIHMLDVDKVYSSAINTGEGTVTCEHGVFPVPAPATLELLKGIPCYSSGIKKEMATPTGVSMFKHFTSEFCSMPQMTIEKVGYGAGGHIIKELPNMLRVVVGSIEDNISSRIAVIETNIDDMNPEFYDHIMDSLFLAGAVDVYLTPIIMKKGRPAIKVSTLVPLEHQIKVSNILINETSTFGIRSYEVDRKTLDRSFINISSRWGKAKVKVGKLDGKILQISPEYEDCKRIADAEGVALKLVYEEILKLAESKLR
ncbi:MAG: nickel pincer cofactor biosynthesis protein LarC [Nitrospinales bacterium]